MITLSSIADLRWKILLFLLGVTVVFVGFDAFSDSYLYPKFTALSVLNLGFIYTAWKERRSMSFDIPILGIAFGLFIVFRATGLIASENFGAGLLSILLNVQILVLACALYNLVSENLSRLKDIWKFGAVLLFIFTVWGFYELWSSNGFRALTHKATYNVFTSLGHRNLFAQFLPFLVLFSLPIFWMKTPLRKVLPLLVFGATCLVLMLLSRGGWFLLGCLSILFIGGFRYMYPGLTYKNQKRTLFVVFAFAVLSAAIFISVLDGWYTVAHQFETAIDISEGTTRDRMLLFKRSMLLFFQQPLVGDGLGDWPISIMQFDQSGMLSESATIYYQRAHNDFAQAFAESGMLSGISLIVLFALGTIDSIKRFKNNSDILSLVLAIGWILLTIVLMTNYPLERFSFGLILAILIGLSSWKISIEPRVVIPLCMAGICISSAVIFSLRLTSEFHFQKALQQRENGNWAEYQAEIDKAEGWMFKVDPTSHPIDWHKGLALSQLGDFQKAHEILLEAKKINPYQPEVDNLLGVISINSGQKEEARAYFESAISRTPGYVQARLNLANVALLLGDQQTAFDNILEANALSMDPMFIDLAARLSVDSLNQMIGDFPERKLMLTITAMRNTPSWALSTLQNAALNKKSFYLQALIDACYYMRLNCNEDCEEVEVIKQKYIPSEKLQQE